MTSSVQLEGEAEQTRSELAHTLEELRDHLTPGQLVDDTLDYARDTVGGEFLHNLSRQAAANPLSVCVVAAGLAWMMLSNSQTASRLGRRSGDGLSRTRATLETTAREAGERIGKMAQDTSERVVDWAAGARDKATDAAGSAARRIKDATEAARSSIGGQAWNNTGEQGSFIGESAASAYDSTKSRVASLMAAARDNRLSVCLIGAGIAWIMLSNSRTASHLGAKASDQLSRGTESVRDAFGEAGQRIAETVQDTSDRIKQGVGDARDKVSDAFRSAAQPESEQTASSLGESGSSVCDSARAQAGSGSGAVIQNTERAYARAGREAQRHELTGLAGEKDRHANEATSVDAPSAENYCRPGEPSVPSSGEHRVMDEQYEKHEPGSAS
jgi:gas vesicle protein